jgi:hypothetical protein
MSYLFKPFNFFNNIRNIDGLVLSRTYYSSTLLCPCTLSLWLYNSWYALGAKCQGICWILYLKSHLRTECWLSLRPEDSSVKWKITLEIILSLLSYQRNETLFVPKEHLGLGMSRALEGKQEWVKDERINEDIYCIINAKELTSCQRLHVSLFSMTFRFTVEVTRVNKNKVWLLCLMRLFHVKNNPYCSPFEIRACIRLFLSDGGGGGNHPNCSVCLSLSFPQFGFRFLASVAASCLNVFHIGVCMIDCRPVATGADIHSQLSVCSFGLLCSKCPEIRCASRHSFEHRVDGKWVNSLKPSGN